jgi:hypothetical protein
MSMIQGSAPKAACPPSGSPANFDRRLPDGVICPGSADRVAHCTTSVNFVACVSVVEPEVKLPDTVML